MRVDLTDAPDAEVGDEVVFLGTQKEEAITIDGLVECWGIDGLDFLGGMRDHIPRIHFRGRCRSHAADGVAAVAASPRCRTGHGHGRRTLDLPAFVSESGSSRRNRAIHRRGSPDKVAREAGRENCPPHAPKLRMG